MHFNTQSYQTSNNFPAAQQPWFPHASLGHDQGGPNTNASGQVARMQTPYHPYPENRQNEPSQQSFGFMARIKYRSTVATCGEEKSKDTLIDSGGSHHFFHNKRSFIEYQSVKNKDVQAAAEMSTIVGKGKVFIPLGGGYLVEAYHTPYFQANILSVGLLTRRFNTLFTMDPPARNFISTCIITQRNTNKIVEMVEIGDDGLYRLDLPASGAQDLQCFPASICTSDKHVDIECIMCPRLFLSSAKTEQDWAKEWHNRTGHPHADRYILLSNATEDVLFFSRQTLNSIFSIPCQLGKSQGQISRTTRLTASPLELVHLDITGKLATPSLGGCHYAVGFVDDFTAKTDVHFIKQESDLFISLKYYKDHSENLTGNRLINIRLDGAGENFSSNVTEFCMMNGIRLEPSPPHAPESNGVAERFMQELGTRARVLLFAANLPGNLWAEAMNHGNWLRNRLPSSRIHNGIPLLQWDSTAKLKYKDLLVFGQQGFSFLYQPHFRPNRKFSARAIHGHFVAMESGSTLYRIFTPSTNKVIVTRRQDFRICVNEKLPGVSALLDGISRQSELEQDSMSTEDALSQAFQAFRLSLSHTLPVVHHAKNNFRDPRLPKSFKKSNETVAVVRSHRP